ncbi:DNA replication protein DnaC [Virgibacillus litoralis]|uniref:DNA replication protein DnaC n=1 Tax=Virgibacillus litoralis TaxID=578221 RepID=A0ABS4HI70_9BACI|nr:DNA replication protein DnaC [Virgibacillus litoralis]
MASLVNKLIEVNQQVSLTKVMKQIEKLDLLVLDELGYIPLHKEGAELLFQVISMCYENKSIVITTNLQLGKWNDVFGGPILTEAVIDRLTHHFHLMLYIGEGFRYKESLLHD